METNCVREPSLPYSRDRGASVSSKGKRRSNINILILMHSLKKPNNCNTQSEMKSNIQGRDSMAAQII